MGRVSAANDFNLASSPPCPHNSRIGSPRPHGRLLVDDVCRVEVGSFLQLFKLVGVFGLLADALSAGVTPASAATCSSFFRSTRIHSEVSPAFSAALCVTFSSFLFAIDAAQRRAWARARAASPSSVWFERRCYFVGAPHLRERPPTRDFHRCPCADAAMAM